MADNYSVYLVLAVAFAAGISVGSFVTLTSYRLPRDEEITFKPSRCPHCQTSLKPADLIPLFSWLMQHGNCRYCKSPISARYPLIEATLGAAFAALAYRYGPSATCVFMALLATELAILIVTDLEHYIIPDSVQIALLVTGIAYAVYRNADMENVVLSIGTGLCIGATLHYGWLYLRKKDALGMGDVKLMAVAGAWLPLMAFVPFFLLAGITGTLTGLLWKGGSKGKPFPFGPALAFSLFINVLFPDIVQKLIL